MNKNIKKINARTITLTILFVLILVVIALLIGKFSYSYLAPTVSDDVEGSGEVTASGDTIIFTKGNTLSLSATTDNFKTNGENLTATTNPKVKLMVSSKTNSASSKYFAGIIIKNNTYSYTTTDKKPEVILTVKDENGNIVESSADNLTFVTVNDNLKGFDITGVNGAFNIVTDHVIATSSNKSEVIHTWTFTLTFVNLGTDQSNNENASLEIDVVLQKNKLLTSIADVCTSGDVLTDCLVKAQNQIGNTIGLYYHNNEMANGAKDNSYRFSGTSNFVKNYVCYGNSDDCYPGYRIVGLFNDNNHGVTGKNLVKVIQSDVSSEEAWRENNFKNSKANEILQNTYYPGLIEHYKDLIANVNWKTGGLSSSNLIAKSAFDEEITNSSDTYSAKVGLIYISDYAFATSPNNWTYSLNLYNKQQIYNSNWMLPSLMISGSSYAYSISIDKNNTGKVFSVYTDGNITTNDINNFGLLTPTFYLNSDVIYAGGSGTYSDPIKIS